MPQRLNSFFTASQELCQISGKVRQLRAFQLQYEQVAPPSLLRASHVIRIEDNVLILAANNSAIASKLRQLTPYLVSQLQLQGSEVTGIQVKVQVTLVPATHTATPFSLSARGKQQLCDLAASLADSPLKNALQRLAGNKKNNP